MTSLLKSFSIGQVERTFPSTWSAPALSQPSPCDRASLDDQASLHDRASLGGPFSPCDRASLGDRAGPDVQPSPSDQASLGDQASLRVAAYQPVQNDRACLVCRAALGALGVAYGLAGLDDQGGVHGWAGLVVQPEVCQGGHQVDHQADRPDEHLVDHPDEHQAEHQADPQVAGFVQGGLQGAPEHQLCEACGLIAVFCQPQELQQNEDVTHCHSTSSDPCTLNWDQSLVLLTSSRTLE